MSKDAVLAADSIAPLNFSLGWTATIPPVTVLAPNTIKSGADVTAYSKSLTTDATRYKLSIAGNFSGNATGIFQINNGASAIYIDNTAQGLFNFTKNITAVGTSFQFVFTGNQSTLNVSYFTLQKIIREATGSNTWVNNTGTGTAGQGLLLTAASDGIHINGTYSSNASRGIYITGGSNNQVFNGTTGTSLNMSGIYDDGGANVSIDCFGKSMVGNNMSNTYGIYSTQFNTTIQNCNISNFQHGIYFDGATNSTVQNTNASTTQNSGYGFDMSGSGKNLINNSQIKSSAFYAFHFEGASTSNTITNNVIDGKLIGIEIQATTGNNISSNTIISRTTFGAVILEGTTGNYVANNIINGTAFGVQALIGYTNSNNSFIGNTVITTGTGYNISSAGANNSIDCSGTNMVGANATNKYGIYSSQPNTTIKNCIIQNFSRAIYLSGASASTLTNNTLSSTNMATLYMDANAQNNTVNGNTLNATGVGINLNNGSFNNFTNNTVYAGSAAINISAASAFNIFYYNNVSANLLVNNSNSTNQFNTTNATGTPQGNYWRAANGTGVWTLLAPAGLIDANNDTWSDTGTSYPLNATNAPAGMWAGFGADYGAYTNITNIAPICLNFTYSSLNPVQVQRIWANVTCNDGNNNNLTVSMCWKINGVADTLNTCKAVVFGGNSTTNFSVMMNYSYTISTASYVTMTNSSNTSNVTNPLYASDNNFATYATANANANISLNFTNSYNDGISAQADVKLINVTGYCYNGSTFASFITPNGTLQEQYFSLPALCFSQTPIQIKLGINSTSMAYDIGLLINRTQTIYPVLKLANYTAYGNVTDGYATVNLTTNSTAIKPVKSPQLG
ncbi:Periplasmic copper-binding protein (NosD) [Candidatus Anstonella stagnisolia]|nr:Periplasmic copper-binding protein (NosD) [Candidatus Anstonella stagnisolia]